LEITASKTQQEKKADNPRALTPTGPPHLVFSFLHAFLIGVGLPGW
jgi:hypothetical protein